MVFASLRFSCYTHWPRRQVIPRALGPTRPRPGQDTLPPSGEEPRPPPGVSRFPTGLAPGAGGLEGDGTDPPVPRGAGGTPPPVLPGKGKGGPEWGRASGGGCEPVRGGVRTRVMEGAEG